MAVFLFAVLVYDYVSLLDENNDLYENCIVFLSKSSLLHRTHSSILTTGGLKYLYLSCSF